MTKKFVNNLYNQIDHEYYKRLDKGHNSKHLKEVVLNTVRLCKLLNVTDRKLHLAMISAIYHDTGLVIGRQEHHMHSKNIVLNDIRLKNTLTDKEIYMIASACENHRESNPNNHTSIISKILADADNIASIDRHIERSYNYNIYNYGNDNTYNRVYRHLQSKFGKNGYAKLILKESKDLDVVKDTVKVLEDEELFKYRYNKVVEKINRLA